MLASGGLANVVNEIALAELPACVVRSHSNNTRAEMSADHRFAENTFSQCATHVCLYAGEALFLRRRPGRQLDVRLLARIGLLFDNQLAAMRFKAEACGQRGRNKGSLLGAVTYTPFGISTVFTVARALSRTPQFGGAGFGWDNHTALVAYVLLTGMTAGDWFAIHYGKGRYIYTQSRVGQLVPDGEQDF